MAERRKAKGVDTGEMESAGGMRWLLTYADLITLLLAMFIILWITSKQDTTKFKAVMEGFQGIFGKPSVIKTGGASMLHGGVKGGPIQKFTPLIPLGKKMTDMAAHPPSGAPPGSKVSVRFETRGLIITLGENGLFERGSADIKQQYKPFLKKLIARVEALGQPVRIEGHTCNLPINTAQFPSNWELSTRRATNVLRFFVQSSFPADMLSAVGYADTRPVFGNDNKTEDHRKKNRRVEIIVLSESAQKLEPEDQKIKKILDE